MGPNARQHLKTNSEKLCLNWKWVHANHVSTGSLPKRFGALVLVISPLQFGVTTGLNWTLNRYPLGGNTGTASSNKATIPTAHSCTTSWLGNNNISLLWAKRHCFLPAAQIKRLRVRATFWSPLKFCFIWKYKAGQTRVIMKIPVQAHIFGHIQWGNQSEGLMLEEWLPGRPLWCVEGTKPAN